MPANNILSESENQPVSWRSAVWARIVPVKWVIGDQALVTGMNFATTALLARVLGVHNFGIFSVLYFCLMFLNNVQAPIVIYPMMTIAPQIHDPSEFRGFLRGMIGFQYLGSLAAASLAALVGVLELLHIVRYPLSPGVILPFVLTVFCFPVQDWFRRFCFVQDLASAAFWNDAISYVGQLAVLVLLWGTRSMSVSTAYYAVAVTSLTAFCWGFANQGMSFTWADTKAAAARSWRLGRNLIVVAQVQWLGAQGVFLLIAAIIGVNEASGIRAAITLMGPVNVIYQTLENVIPVRASRAFAEGGQRSLVSYLLRTITFLGVLVGAPILLASMFARPIMELVFGHAYAPFASLVAWQGAYMWLTLIYRGLVYYHRTMNTTTVLARSAMLVAVVSTVACVFLTRRFGAAGGMAALVIGQLFSIGIPLYAAIAPHPGDREAS